MSIQTFEQCVELDEIISIGGGEPTIHPKFWEMMGLAIGHCEYVWLATNGKETSTALALAKIARRGVIGVDLSLDDWHDSIDDRVVKAYTIQKQRGAWQQDQGPNDLRSIRNVGNHHGPINAGRCDWGNEHHCVCTDLFIKPNGDVHGCGCKDAPCFGNVHGGIIIPENWESGECHRDQENVGVEDYG